MADMHVRRVFERSAIRRGRLQTRPVFRVRQGSFDWRFLRKRDALAFIYAGGCRVHLEHFCSCGGTREFAGDGPLEDL